VWAAAVITKPTVVETVKAQGRLIWMPVVRKGSIKLSAAGDDVRVVDGWEVILGIMDLKSNTLFGVVLKNKTNNKKALAMDTDTLNNLNSFFADPLNDPSAKVDIIYPTVRGRLSAKATIIPYDTVYILKDTSPYGVNRFENFLTENSLGGFFIISQNGKVGFKQPIDPRSVVPGK